MGGGIGDEPKGNPEVDSKPLDFFALVWVLQNQTLKQGFESQQTFWEVTPRSTDGGKGYKTGRGEATSGASVSK